MDRINELFNRLDDWRDFPDYQLERRADIFFSLYLREVLERKLGFPVSKQIVPEFPVHTRLTENKVNREKADRGDHKEANRSNKIDYFAISAEPIPKAIFIELKTDLKSLKKDQNAYLEAACEAGVNDLLEGIRRIFAATDSKRKYYCLLDRLEEMGLLGIPPAVKARMKHERTLRGLGKELADISVTEIARSIADCRVVYILPEETLPEKPKLYQISFQEFALVVRGYGDPLSQRFAESLDRWSKVKAGRGRLT